MSIPAMQTASGLFLSNTDSDAITDVNPNFSYVRAHSFSPERFAPLISGDGYVRLLKGWGQGDNQIVSLKFLRVPEPGELDA